LRNPDTLDRVRPAGGVRGEDGVAEGGLGDSKRRIIDHLKRNSHSVTGDLAARLGISEAAIRLHLGELEARGLVVQSPGAAAGRGRPPKLWSLTGLAQELFPDRHGDLTVELVASIRAAFGEDGLDAVLAARAERQAEALAEIVPAGGSLADRAEALAAQRTREGYVAEVVVDDATGDLLLVEHHCPVCEAATACQGLCRTELALFQRALGPDADVERTQHLLSDDERCIYRIRGR
jgi:predicted ArsR family transcriptional regulator